jgi:hypothetical protein
MADWWMLAIKYLKRETHLNIIEKFSSYLTENILRVHIQDQSVGVGYRSNGILLYESCEIREYDLWVNYGDL